MADPRRYLGTFAVLSLVLLRLIVGWHFFTQGLEKVSYDSSGLKIDFSASDFLNNAKGPLAERYRTFASDVHDWRTHLAVPRENSQPSAEDEAEHSRWIADYERRRAEATKNKTTPPVEFPPFAPYFDWAQQIDRDWQATMAKIHEVPGLTDEQIRAAEAAVALRRQQLADYLAGESEAIGEYRHQLWRLNNWRDEPEALGLPYQQERISAKQAETTPTVRAWVSQVEGFDQLLLSDIADVLTPQQKASETSAALAHAQTSPQEARLQWVNLAVTCLTIGVGVCLLLGLFTRLASIVGALFLLSVIASQPPWLPDAVPTIQQAIEFAALLVLAGTAAGRWLGLDYFTYAMFGRRGHDEA